MHGLNVPIAVNRETRGVGNTRVVICATTLLGSGPRLMTTGTDKVPAFRHSGLFNTVSEVCGGYVNVYKARNGAAAASVAARVVVATGLSPSTMVNKGLPVVNSDNEINGDRGFIYRTYRFISAFLSLSPSITIVLGVSRSRLSCFGALSGLVGDFRGFTSVTAGTMVCGNSSTGALGTVRNVSNGSLVAFNVTRRGSCCPRGVTPMRNTCCRFSTVRGNRFLYRVGLEIPKLRGILGTLTTLTTSVCSNTSTRSYHKKLSTFDNTREHFRLLNGCGNIAFMSSCTRRPTRLGIAVSTTVRVKCRDI